jgi:hypothetical protein
MPRGGLRENHVKPNWRSGTTCTVRIPEARRNEIMGFARLLDEFDSEVKVIDADIYRQAIEKLRETYGGPRNNSRLFRDKIIEALELLGEAYAPTGSGEQAK